MATARKDANFVTTLTAVLNTDGQTIELILSNPLTHALRVNDGTTGIDNGPKNALKDLNNTSTLLATSAVDGLTPVVCYSDSNGALLIQST